MRANCHLNILAFAHNARRRGLQAQASATILAGRCRNPEAFTDDERAWFARPVSATEGK